MLQLSIIFYDLTFISLPQKQQQPRPVEAGCASQDLGDLGLDYLQHI